MTHEELIDLLREARDRLSLHMEIYFSQQKGSMFLTIDLVDRIEAALAERQDSAKDVVESDAVEWRDCLAVDESMFLAADLSDKVKVSVYQEEATPGAYAWRAVRIEAQKGTATTETEAKEAAIAAARGVR